MNVKESQNVRDSNYELMRVISMCMIVIWHILLHGLVEVQSTGILSFVIYLLEAFLVVHVNSYILVTGYYQCRKKFQLKKLIALNNQSWFYRIIIMFILCGNGMIEIRRKEFFQAFFPLDYATYWFVQMYLFLYCFSPFLNRLIEKICKKEFQVLLMICLIVFSILPTISMQVMIPIEKGHSLMSMVFMYLLGAYFRYYPIQESRILKVAMFWKSITDRWRNFAVCRRDYSIFISFLWKSICDNKFSDVFLLVWNTRNQKQVY